MVHQSPIGSMSSSTQRHRSDCGPRSRRQRLGGSSQHLSEFYGEPPDGNEMTRLRKIMQLSRKLSLDPLRRRYTNRTKKESPYQDTTNSTSSSRSRSHREQRNPSEPSFRRNEANEVRDPPSYNDYRENFMDDPFWVANNSPSGMESRQDNDRTYDMDGEQVTRHRSHNSHEDGMDETTKEPLSLIGELLSYMSEDEETTFSEFIGRKYAGTRHYLSPPSRIDVDDTSGTYNTDSEGSMIFLHARDDGCFAAYDRCLGKVMDPHSLRMQRSLSWDDSIHRGKACGF